MANAQNRWAPFEHQIYRDLQAASIRDRKLLVMLSGGADSMALVACLQALQSALGLGIQVLHCHHGPALDPLQNAYRNQAQALVGKFCQEVQINCRVIQRETQNRDESEASLREFRKSACEKVRAEMDLDFSLWAHHRDDLIETQILRLIRGAGLEAVVEPMKFQRGSEIRPFLRHSKVEILSYLRDKKIEWIEDPSNQNQDYLRNWLRQNWLPQLEEKCPGSLSAFSRSLDLLQETNADEISAEIWTDQGLRRSLFLALNESQKMQVLARFLRRCGKLDFSQNQIKEVMRHLDKSVFDHTFRAAQVTWSITRDFIQMDGPYENE